MLGSYAPKPDWQHYSSPPRQYPSGMLVRGGYLARCKVRCSLEPLPRGAGFVLVWFDAVLALCWVGSMRCWHYAGLATSQFVDDHGNEHLSFSYRFRIGRAWQWDHPATVST
jgi:hypothetical protein